MTWYMIAFGGVLGLWLLSYIVELLRPQPAAPTRLAWAPGVNVEYATVDGLRLRYIVAGQGPAVVLLHTLRTQLDLFLRVIDPLSREFRVYAFDYPGHGYSDIPEADYDPALFARSVRGFLQEMRITDAVIVGESIGGALGLLLAAEHNPRIRGVIAINSYDYDKGRGITRGSVISRLIFAITRIPILGGIVWRLRWEGAFATIIKGSVNASESLPPDLVHEMHVVGNRRDHYVAFMSLVEHFPEWEALRARYGTIAMPVLLLYGEHDWSRAAERDSNRTAIPGAGMEIVPGAGHLLSLERPEATIAAVRRFARSAEAAAQ